MAPYIIGAFPSATAAAASASSTAPASTAGLANDYLFWGLVEKVKPVDEKTKPVELKAQFFRLFEKVDLIVRLVAAVTSRAVKALGAKFPTVEVKEEDAFLDMPGGFSPATEAEQPVLAIPEIIITAPSMPSLTEDDTSSAGEASEPSSPSLVTTPDLGDDVDLADVYVGEEEINNKLFDQLHMMLNPGGPFIACTAGLGHTMETIEEEASSDSLAYLAYDTIPSIGDLLAAIGAEDIKPDDTTGTEAHVVFGDLTLSPPSLATILEESSETISDLSGDSSVPSISDLLAAVSADDDAISQLSIPTIDIPTPDASVQLAYAISEADVSPVKTEVVTADEAVEEFVVTPATIKRSALKSPVKVNWKKFKRSVSFPHLLNGIAVHGKGALTSIKDAAKGKSFLGKVAQRDVGYFCPNSEDDEETPRSAPVTTDTRSKRRSFTTFF
ncbi:hypothetical protein EIP91_006544 [Steccherinum ochraceum]|uniref:Uncharacterized protein n=1 Tax=Steccherinum ochraceum TaxID=92696 RepID=A0A4R0RBC9_9APHY|nr:hypothetical protein EIP91_006544 [Steccherinum ochraceum]